MTLRQKQSIFAGLLARLLDHAIARGYDVTLGEAYRPPETAALYAEQGKGINGSLHTSRLAIDLNLFRDGKLLTKTEQYQALGEWWEEQGTEKFTTAWGGRFGDGNHFSIEHGGRK